MADYRELLRGAVDALPENNGAARRQVYEKARNALVAQLRAIQPPLAAREITQHRLQLEDCIREVEQIATEELLAGSRAEEEAAARAKENAPVEAAPVEAAPKPDVTPAPAAPKPAVTTPEPVVAEKPATPAEAAETKDDIKSDTVKSDTAKAEPKAAEKTKPAEDKKTENKADSKADAKGADKAADAKPAAKEEPAASEEKPKEADAAKPEPKAKSEPKSESKPESKTESKSGDKAPAPTLEPLEADKAQNSNSAASEAAIQQLIQGAAEDGARVKGPEPKAEPEAKTEAKSEPSAAEAAKPEADNAPETKSADAPSAKVSQTDSKSEAADAKVAPAKDAAAEPKIDTAPAVASDITAMSAEREVDLVAPALDSPSLVADANEDAQSTVDRAIEALDREARGVEEAADKASEETKTKPVPAAAIANQFGPVDPPTNESSGGGVTIFLIVLAVLLVGVSGAGFWAWREGYIDLDAMFSQSETIVEADAGQKTAPEPDDTTRGNTAAAPDAVAPVEQELTKSDERLSGADDTQTPVAEADQSNTADKNDERLGAENSFTPSENSDAQLPQNGEDAAGPVGGDGTAQSLLLEASTEGTTGAVPFSGNVEWIRGADELGQPTLIAKANIPARNLGVELLIRRNADQTLPASHLIEVDFTVSDSFIGGAVASLPGILLKNEELVRGVPLVGASARVVGNSFLFALSAADQDLSKNLDLLTSRKWMDLALIYATSTRAIITLEKDAAAQKLFEEVLAIWAEADKEAAANGAASAAQ